MLYSTEKLLSIKYNIFSISSCLKYPNGFSSELNIKSKFPTMAKTLRDLTPSHSPHSSHTAVFSPSHRPVSSLPQCLCTACARPRVLPRDSTSETAVAVQIPKVTSPGGPSPLPRHDLCARLSALPSALISSSVTALEIVICWYACSQAG